MILNMCTKSGIGNCFIILSALINPAQPSFTTVVKKDQRIIPLARNGKNSSKDVLKMEPKTIPMVPIITPILIVNQKGPNAERRYRCFTSCQPSIPTNE